MNKTFTFFTLTLCNILLFSSFSTNRKSKDLIILEYVINQNKEIKDSIKLKQNFNSLSSESTSYISKNLNIIYQVYLAKIYAENLDKLNPKTEALFDSARKNAIELELIDMQIWVNTQYGFYYYNFSQYQKAYPYFMEAARLIEQTEENKIFQKSDIFKKNAFFFMNVKELDKSENYLLSALKYTNKNSNEYATILNSLGHINLEKNDYIKANNYFILTKNIALQNNDKIRYAKALGDIAAINIHNKEYDLAIENLRKDIQISRETNNFRNLMYANIKLGELFIQLNKIDEAEKILKEAKKYASEKPYLLSYEKEIYSLLLQIAIKNQNTIEELEARRRLSVLEDELKNTDGENVINEINWNIQKDNYNYKYETEKVKNEKATILKNAFILIASLLSIIIIFIIFAFKRKTKIQNSIYQNKVLKLHNDKLKSENRLNKAKQTLDSYKTYLEEKNSQILTLNKEISGLSSSNTALKEKHHLEFSNLLDSHLMTNENWTNFKNVFAYEQQDFVEYLNKNFADLTESNLRIIYLVKLGLTNSETAQLLGITVDSVKKAKQRLKKKYENYDQIFSAQFNNDDD